MERLLGASVHPFSSHFFLDFALKITVNVLLVNALVIQVVLAISYLRHLGNCSALSVVASGCDMVAVKTCKRLRAVKAGIPWTPVSWIQSEMMQSI